MTTPSRIDGLPDLPSHANSVLDILTAIRKLDAPTEAIKRALDAHGCACYEAGSAAAAQAAKQVPAGFWLVPREPTIAMKRAGLAERHDDLSASIYKAMIASAPSATSLAEAAVRPPMCRIAGVSEGVLRRAAIANGHGASAAEAGQVEAAHQLAGDFVEHSHPEFGQGYFCTPDVFAKIEALAVTPASPQAPAPQAVVGVASEDTKRLNWLDRETPDLKTVQTAEDDFDWVVTQHHMAKPHEREIGRGKNPRDAIDAAMGSVCSHCDGSGDDCDGDGEGGGGPWCESCNGTGADLTPSPAPSAAPHQGADALREADTPWQLLEMARRVSAAYRHGTLTIQEIHYMETMIERAEKMPTAARDVMAERRRQLSAEGWTPAHDDEHGDGSMAQAAACYALHTEPVGNVGDYLRFWPWESEWWKPKDRRRNLVRAAALILAEIERLDRAALAQHQAPQQGEQHE